MTETSAKKIGKDPEVPQKAARRRFTGEYKRRIALEAESCSQPGEIGALRNVSTSLRQLLERIVSARHRTRGPAPEPPGFFQA